MTRLLLLAATLTACAHSPEPWTYAHPEVHCATDAQREQVKAHMRECSQKYTRHYCRGAATVDVCLEEK